MKTFRPIFGPIHHETSQKLLKAAICHLELVVRLRVVSGTLEKRRTIVVKDIEREASQEMGS